MTFISSLEEKSSLFFICPESTKIAMPESFRGLLESAYQYAKTEEAEGDLATLR